MTRANATMVAMMTVCAMMAQACGWEAVEGNGIAAEELRAPDSFSRVEISGGAFKTIDLYVCSCNKIRITGDENLLEFVDTRVRAGELTVEMSENVRTDEPLVVEIYTPSLESVNVSGSSNIRVIDLSGGALAVSTSGSSDVKLKGALDRLSISTSGSSDIDIVELESRHLEVETSGSSDLDLYGEVDRFDLRTSGSSDVRARELSARDVSIRTSGSSDVEVCVTQTLDVRVSGSGDVDYYCAPHTVNREVSGSGTIRAR